MAEKNICFQHIKWEWFRKNKVFQCRNCQRVGHASMNCNFIRRCVKCAEPHGKDECPVAKGSDRSSLKCANCKNTGHPASYFGCPYLMYAQNQLNNQREINRNKIQQKITTVNHNLNPRSFQKVKPGVSFANLTSNQKNNYPALRHKDNYQQHTDNNTIADLPQSNPQYQQPTVNMASLQSQIADLTALIKHQTQLLSTQIAHNASKINYLFELNDLE